MSAVDRPTRRYQSPEPLAARHELTEFTCRSTEQTDWLRRHARQSAATGTTRVFAVTEQHEQRVIAYYAWCMTQIGSDAVPRRAQPGAGRCPQPVALLARLGVDIHHEHQGLAAGMLLDVFARLVGLSDEIGCRGLLVHAEADDATSFYRHLVPEFERSPTDDLHLMLLMKDIRRTLQVY